MSRWSFAAQPSASDLVTTQSDRNPPGSGGVGGDGGPTDAAALSAVAAEFVRHAPGPACMRLLAAHTSVA
jgi:hypothetical protein